MFFILYINTLQVLMYTLLKIFNRYNKSFWAVKKEKNPGFYALPIRFIVILELIVRKKYSSPLVEDECNVQIPLQFAVA